MSELALSDGMVFHGNGSTFPSHGVITAINLGVSTVVASWILMCLMAVTVLARVGTRQNVNDNHSLAICAACKDHISLIGVDDLDAYSRQVLTNFPEIGTSYCADHSNPSCRPLRSWKTHQKRQRGRI